MNTYPTDYSYLYGEPKSSAVIRECNRDFQVTEIPAFEPDGEGEHWYLYICKEGENSDWIAKQLAVFFNVSSKAVGYAGKKDRHAVTKQWFSVCLPGVKEINIEGFESETVRVLDIQKHSRKLRTGALKGNTFQLRIKNINDESDFEQRLLLIKDGVPNYFGDQRFGIAGGNLRRGVALMKGEFKERNRTKKGMYLSAVRSWLFNHVLSNRIASGQWDQPLLGDIAMLEGSKSHFLIDDLSSIVSRIEEHDLHLTGPMWGSGKCLTEGAAADWELSLTADFPEITTGLEKAGMNQERRSLRVLAKHLQYEREEKGTWLISFELPPGAFATSVLRELCVINKSTGEK